MPLLLLVEPLCRKPGGRSEATQYSENETNLSNRVVAAHADLHVVLTNFQVSFKIQLLGILFVGCSVGGGGIA